jgi:hypothetical protein
MEGAGMTVDTSRERVEGLARVHDIGAQSYGDDNDAGLIALASTTAATLRALLAERDAARAACAQWQRAAEEHGGRYWEARYRDEAASASTAYARGAKAMREACVSKGTRAWPRAHTYASENADIYRAQDHAVSVVIDAIAALPLPEPEDKQ